jgi:hypothetical protein
MPDFPPPRREGAEVNRETHEPHEMKGKPSFGYAEGVEKPASTVGAN